MIHDTSVSVTAFLDACAARQPTPGGGAVAALAGALAASMGEMVLNYSVGKKGLEEFQSELKPALEQFNRLRKILEQLVVEDQAAYEEMTRIRKLPPDTPSKSDMYAAAVLAAVRVPQAIVATGVGVLELCDHMVNFVNPMLLSDLAVAADLAMASTRCGLYNVKINLPQLPLDAERRAIEVSLNEMLMRAAKVVQRVSGRIWERIELEST